MLAANTSDVVRLNFTVFFHIDHRRQAGSERNVSNRVKTQVFGQEIIPVGSQGSLYLAAPRDPMRPGC